MKHTKLILADFDRTLFIPSFYEAFLSLLAKNGHLEAKAIAPILQRIDDPTQQTDFLQIIRDSGLTVATAIQLAQTELNPNHFLYPDVPAFLVRHQAHQLTIITTGNRQWQIVKLDFCSQLRSYPKIILPDNKGEYLRDTLIAGPDGLSIQDYAGDWFSEIHLIDDRLACLTPLLGIPGIKLWHLQRPGAKYASTHKQSGITPITSLEEAA
jgi:hypothetical protein